MTRTFKRHGDAIRMELEPFEVELLRSLHEELRARLVESGEDDPVRARLFPPAVPEDGAVDAEVRALIHDDLLQSRLEGLDELAALLDRGGRTARGKLRVDLEEEEPALVLGVLNDIRLAIGVRVGIDRLDRDSLDEDDPAAHSVAVMDHFAWLQEQLLAVLDPPSVQGG